ncbi:DUF6973 domain-containing protein [Lentiprolixibacter aurantiacus]|uniref:DUF6973 domain-containing protein n=1 Tax=Lentiprolixibacter aurantiacus TaxID=2993939 RepID=A0AAE3SMK0_9FLAO|nr:hypothetical protein [Lentiprolixibacter aurantiacus]MCX2718664.1 hypothetical protein [Lentiprolixibacter aurantiacus]
MNVWKHLSGLNPAALWALFLLCIRNPWYVLPTVKATRKCVAVCNLHYGKAHHRNTAANAFRHALWNFYIVRACSRGKAKMDKVLAWAEKITTWHEDFSKNPPLARQMDLHNNRVGRIIFEKDPHMEAADVIDLLKSKAAASVKVTELKETEAIDSNCFIHLID